MRSKNIVSPVGLLVSFAAVLAAQAPTSPLNNFPSRNLGWPLLNVTNGNPNLVEGREFDAPQGVALDNSVSPPVLYVSDFGNNRVLAWKNSTSFSNGQSADFVVGQKDFFSTTALGPGTTFSSGLSRPTSLAVDKSGNLYILDAGNNRILRFPAPYNQPGQPLPDLVIGQIGLSCAACAQANSGGLSAKTIAISGNSTIFGAGITFDATGNLWLTDAANNRILRYPVSVLGANAANGPAADLVLGQLGFTTSTPPALTSTAAQSTGTLYQPLALAFDPTGRLYVADSFDRVLVYPANLQSPVSNGTPALRLMGIAAPSKVPPPPINEVQFGGVSGVFMVGTSPGIVDAGNHRILLFDPFEQWPTDGTSPHAKATAGPIGQFGYNAGLSNRGLAEAAAITLSAPTAAVPSASELFVADTGNHRVLVFPLANLGQNSTATRLLGQSDFPFRSANLIEGREMNFAPGNGSGDGAVLVDMVSATPHLYVADTYNNRVLGFKDARTVKPGVMADIVIGQPDFQRAVVNYPNNDPTRPTSQSLNAPVGLALDAGGNLFVADAGNGRVLRFPQPFNQSVTAFEQADLVLGQSSLTAQVTDPTARTMRLPYGLAFTSSGGLLVSDAGLNRVVYFKGPEAGFTSGMDANQVFGQPDFNSIAAGTDTNQMNTPRHIATDSDDRLYVADEKNSRVLIFDQVPLITTFARAGTILTGPTQSGNFAAPRGLWVHPTNGEIWVTEASATRVSRFPSFNNLPSNQNQSDFQIGSNAGLAVTQDAFGNLFVAESVNRISLYFPPLTGVNGANLLPNRALAPGTVVTLNSRPGLNLVPSSVSNTNPAWPTTLGDTQVLVNNAPAPINFVGINQVNFLMPMNVGTTGNVEADVVRASTGQILAVGMLPVAPVSPGLFTTNGFGTGQLVATNDDGSVNQPSQPVGRGHVVSIFGTGQGFVTGAPPDGTPPSGQVPTNNKPDVWIEPSFVDPANIMYSGLAPNQVGVWEIDFKVPDLTAPSPTVQVFIRSQSVASSQAPQVTTISVKQ
jgi:uncharacterized protein (TIGR03437 family)